MAPAQAQLVAAVAGEATLREMLLEAVQLDAREMKARGFLQRVVPHETWRWKCRPRPIASPSSRRRPRA
jgi:enoyl-CoA hydratase/carnithine racemase